MYGDNNDDERSDNNGQRESSLERQLEHQRRNCDENPESQYNDNQGIKYVIAFQPNPPPLKSGEKRRRNARTEIIKCVTYIHEDSSMAEVIKASFLAVGRNPESLKFKVVGQELRTTAFSIKYSIPGRSPLKDMQLSTTAHFDELLKEAVKKGSPEVKLEITEDPSNVSANAPANTNTAANTGESDDELALGSKTKKRKLTEEEESIAETITQLKAIYACSDKRCNSPICFLGNATGQHIQLTPIHLSTWASAMLAKVEDVDLQNPPPDKMFHPLEGQDDIDDIGLLARRCNQSNKPVAATTQITVVPDYSGLATLLQSIQNPHPATPIQHRSAAPSPVKPAHMTFEMFCQATNILHLFLKLEVLEIEGPHLLDFVTDTDLDKYLSVGQRAALRYAHAQWKKGLVR
ncbi:hypothetical protein B0H14DRAFT_3437062 [Mycena olivaceomarginata]|nr:hypothetical protein B0H14DRAFT_3437062 [Mycena olivaceomarginata]